MTTVAQVLSRVKISSVYRALTGIKLIHAGNECYRGPAVWRSGDNNTAVSFDDNRGVWHDFVTGEGGGIIDLVVRIMSDSRQNALKWLADYAGIPLDDKPMAPEDRQKWAEEQQRLERYLPLAQLWRRGIVRLTDELLDRHKDALSNPELPQARINEIFDTEYLLRRLEHMEGRELIDEFLWWDERYPGITGALIAESRRRADREVRALKRFIREMGPADVSTTGH